jgi:hypothetical protein
MRIEITFTDEKFEVIDFYGGHDVRNGVLIIQKKEHARDKIVYPLCSIKKFKMYETH